jgi:hypothetical protein
MKLLPHVSFIFALVFFLPLALLWLISVAAWGMFDFLFLRSKP